MTAKRYIHIRNWDRFQHYKKRGAPWIKDYVAQLNNPDWYALTLRQRGLLQGLRLLYAAGGRQGLGQSAAKVGQMLGDSTVRERDFEALNDAGFLLFSASKMLAQCEQDATPEEETETEEEKKDQEHLSFLPTALRPPTENGRKEGDHDLELLNPWNELPTKGAA